MIAETNNSKPFTIRLKFREKAKEKSSCNIDRKKERKLE
jgi:hypothetical protein